MPSQSEILAALAAVPGPDGRTPLPQSGALDGITQRDDKVFIAIRINRAAAAEMGPMQAAVENAVKALPGVGSVLVTLTAEHTGAKPPPSSRARAARGRPIEGVDKIIAVASGKGGVGKSTTACNLALGLVRLGLKVGVLDADVFGPSMPRLFGIKEKPTLADDKQKLRPIEKYGVKVMSIGFLVEDNSAIVWRGPMVQSALTQMLNDSIWAPLDILVIDMPPGTGDAQLTISQRVPLRGAVIVSTPQDLALIDARKGLAMFNKTQVPVLGIIENMSTFICPHCGKQSDIFGHGGARSEAKKLAVPFLGEIPLVPAIRETSDRGTPIMVHQPDGPEAQAFRAIAQEIVSAVATAPRQPPRILME